MEEWKLNKKLAEWVFSKEQGDLRSPCEGGHYVADDGKIFYGVNGLPDFTQSLDACFKWLVPRLEFYLLDSELNTKGLSHHAVVRFKGRRVQQWADTPAHAFCLAIDKLID